jgi:hypothetical protein
VSDAPPPSRADSEKPVSACSSGRRLATFIFTALCAR